MNDHKKNSFLNEMFPGQFDTGLHIIIWSIVFIVDVLIVFGVAHLLGIPLPIGGSAWGKIGLTLYLVAAFGIFCLESYLYNLIKY